MRPRPASQWTATLEGLVRYRLHLKTRFGLLTHAEIKANYLLQNGGAFRQLGLTERASHSLYRGLLRLCPKLDLKVFAVVIRKQLLKTGDPRDLAWTLVLRRLTRLTTEQDVQAIIFHDEGDDMRIRALARRAQLGMAGLAFGTAHAEASFRGLLEDPVSRHSHESLFLQFADLVAYVAFRRVFPPPDRPVQIVPQLMWDNLGASVLAEGNQRSDWPSPGITTWPGPEIERASF